MSRRVASLRASSRFLHITEPASHFRSSRGPSPRPHRLGDDEWVRAILQFLERHEGVASLGELMRDGHDMRTIWLLADYRRQLFRASKGIYALVGTPPLVLDAVRAGGQLDCISALAHHGVREREPGEKMHIRVPSTARPRRAQARDDVVIHWSRRPFSGTRASVTEEEARRQAARCRHRTPDTL